MEQILKIDIDFFACVIMQSAMLLATPGHSPVQNGNVTST